MSKLENTVVLAFYPIRRLLTWPESDTVKQQSLMVWSMIGFSRYRTVRDVLPKGQQSHQERPTHRMRHWQRRQEMNVKPMSGLCLYMIRCLIHVVIMIRYDYVSAYKRSSDGDQCVVGVLLLNQALNLRDVFLCHDEAE